MSFLSPVSEHEAAAINSYSKWEQAFRIYSNILTNAHPAKATELIQYMHVIHTTALSYVWENVYAYDKEFRYHIPRHPSRSWAVILQQAWTMLIKDRIRPEGLSRNNRGHRSGEVCKCFNRGKCSFGLSCRYDHRCAI